MKFFIFYLVIINLYGFYLMKEDKIRAKKKQWRVPEGKLFIIASILGSIGILLAMFKFRHKTKHLKFTLGIPLIILCQVFLISYFISK